MKLLGKYMSLVIMFKSPVFDAVVSFPLQREDLAGFGRLILTLACGSAVNALLDFMASHYSPDLVRITQALLAEKSEGVGISSIRQLYSVLAERMFGEVHDFRITYNALVYAQVLCGQDRSLSGLTFPSRYIYGSSKYMNFFIQCMVHAL